jgi:nucleoside-diphosphate-sugar epimerase
MNNEVLKEDVQLFAEQFELREQLKGKTFLITGATGLIGSVMVKCLLALNQRYALHMKIMAVVRDLQKAKKVFEEELDAISFVEIPLTDLAHHQVSERVDYIIHLASPTASSFFVNQPVETLATIFNGTQSVLRYAKEADVEAMVLASSLEIYGSNENDEPIIEDFQGYLNPTEVRSSYNMGKRAAECLCHAYAKEYGIPVKIARLTQTTGAGISQDDNRVIAQFARLAAEGKDIILHTTGESARPYCYTTDAVSAILYILLKGQHGEPYNVANEETYISAHDMAHYLKKNFNPDISVRIELNDHMGYAPASKLYLSTQKIKTLGWQPRYGLKDIFSRLIAYMK